MDPFMQAAIEEAETGLSEGGVPIGSDLPPLNGTASRERIWGCDAAPNLVPVGLLAMQGR